MSLLTEPDFCPGSATNADGAPSPHIIQHENLPNTNDLYVDTNVPPMSIERAGELRINVGERLTPGLDRPLVYLVGRDRRGIIALGHIFDGITVANLYGVR